MKGWLASIVLGMLLQGGAVFGLASRDRVRAAMSAALAELTTPVLAYLVLPSIGVPLRGRQVLALGVVGSIVVELCFYVALIPSLRRLHALGVCVAGNVLGLWLSSFVSSW